jgi:uncharacterized membrane protein YcaP (DUF421 family)
MHSAHFKLLLAVLALLCMGGQGFAAYRYPEFLMSINIAFGIKWSLGRHLTRVTGIVWMAFVVTLSIVLAFLKMKANNPT